MTERQRELEFLRADLGAARQLLSDATPGSINYVSMQARIADVERELAELEAAPEPPAYVARVLTDEELDRLQDLADNEGFDPKRPHLSEYVGWRQIANLLATLHGFKSLLAAFQKCSTCGGQPHPSGLVCVCGGTGRHEEEVLGLRVAAQAAGRYAAERDKAQETIEKADSQLRSHIPPPEDWDPREGLAADSLLHAIDVACTHIDDLKSYNRKLTNVLNAALPHSVPHEVVRDGEVSMGAGHLQTANTAGFKPGDRVVYLNDGRLVAADSVPQTVNIEDVRKALKEPT